MLIQSNPDLSKVQLEVKRWLSELGFQPKLSKDGHLVFRDKVGKQKIEITVRILAELRLEVVSPYLPFPQGPYDQVLDWWKNITKRMWGASFSNMPNYDPSNQEPIMVWDHVHLTVGHIGDKGRLFRSICDIREHFLCWEYDIEDAHRRGLKFPTLE